MFSTLTQIVAPLGDKKCKEVETLKMAAIPRKLESSSRKRYIYDLTHTALEEISLILDTNEKWKHLGSTFFGFSITDLSRFNRCNLQGTSPSYTMLLEWGHQNHTITELYHILAKMQQYRAMKLLQKYVDPRHHYLTHDGSEDTVGHTVMKEPEESCVSSWNSSGRLPLPKPPLPESANKRQRIPMQETAYGTAFGIPHPHSQARLHYDQQNGIVSQDLDFQLKQKLYVDPHNLNQPDTSSFPSKMPLAAEFGAKSSDQAECGNQLYHASYGSHLPRPPLPNISIPPTTSQSDRAEKSIEDNTFKPSHQETPFRNWPTSAHQNRRSSDSKCVASSFSGDSISIQYDDIVAATKDFAKEKILGRGGFGIVYEGCWNHTKVAIKRIIKQENPGWTSLEEAKVAQSYVELRTLTKYRHDNILPLYGYSIQDDGLCLIYQFMVNGSLEDRLRTKNDTPPLNWKQRLYIARGSARGIQFLHNCDKPIIHGDIKSANILLDANMEPKIGDFGLAREGPVSQCTYTVVSAVHGTQPYLPSEYIKDRRLSTKVDTYSFGIVMFELATGLRAYDETKRKHKFLRDFVMECDPMKYETLRDLTAGEEFKDAFMEFVHTGSRCAASRKKDRPEMVQVLECLENKYQALEAKENAGAGRPVLKPVEDDLNATKYNTPETNEPRNVLSAQGTNNLQVLASDASLPSVENNETVVESEEPTATANFQDLPNLTALGIKNPSEIKMISHDGNVIKKDYPSYAQLKLS